MCCNKNFFKCSTCSFHCLRFGNNFIHHYACNANREGLDIEEVKSYCSSYTDSTLTYQEIERTIRSAYENNTSEFGKMQSVQFVQSCSKEDKSPIIPEEVYENLPPVLRESCEVFIGRERDVWKTQMPPSLPVLEGDLELQHTDPKTIRSYSPLDTNHPVNFENSWSYSS